MHRPRHATLAAIAAAVAAAGVIAGTLTGAPSGTVSVTARIAPTVTFTTPGGVVRLNSCRQSPTPERVLPVTVVSNAPAGYRLRVTRTVFTPSDVTTGFQVRTAPSGTVIDPAAAGRVWRTLVPGALLGIGGRTGATPTDGDTWVTAVRFGPVSRPIGTELRGVISYRLTVGTTITSRDVTVVLTQRGNCGAGGDR